MKFLKDNEKNRSVIVNFFKEKRRTVKSIVFQEDAAVVVAKDDEMTEIFDKFISSPTGSPQTKRTIVLMEYLSSKMNGYGAFDQMFLVNDFECYSFLDLVEEHACDFTKDWVKSMHSTLKEGADDYLCEAEDYFRANSEEK